MPLRSALFALLFVLLTLVFTAPVGATPPISQTFALDATFPATKADGSPVCNFEVLAHLEGTVTVSTHFNQAGQPTFELSRFTPITVTLMNPTTGVSLITRATIIDKVTYDSNGSFTAAQMGLTGMIHLPGQGFILLDVGRVVVDENNTVIFAAGPHTLAGDTGELCAALASP